MKNLLTTLMIVFAASTVMAQKSITPDSIKKVCKDRGHSLDGWHMSTTNYCPPYKKKYPDSTVIVYPACNTSTTICTRCKATIRTKENERHVTIWRRKK